MNIKNQKFDNVWDALEDTPSEAENMKVKSALMSQIASHIKRSKFTQAEAAKICQITQPRMSDLVNGRISKFSLDALVNIAAASGLHVEFNLTETFA